MTVDQALDLAISRLRAGGVSQAPLDAELLLRHVLGWDRARVLSNGGNPLSAADEGRFFFLVAARARRRPLQHLTGTQAFWRHEFVVGPAVLIPRPETEVLVEAVLGLLEKIAAPRVIDVGTGSGCIALSLAAERAEAEVVATDLSAAALQVARENASRLDLTARVRFVRGDLLDAFHRGAGGPIDVVVSNPPYVSEEEWRSLAPEVRDHDPRSALVAPAGVAEMYRRLLEGASRVLRPGGWVAVEVGDGQWAATLAQAAAAGFHDLRTLRDLQDISRVVVARRAT